MSINLDNKDAIIPCLLERLLPKFSTTTWECRIGEPAKQLKYRDMAPGPEMAVIGNLHTSFYFRYIRGGKVKSF